MLLFINIYNFAGRVSARRHLTKLNLDRLLRERNGLMIYSKIETALVITKQIFNYYNSNILPEITSKVTFKAKWNTQDCGISKA